MCPQGGPRLRILSSGRYLQINNAELGDRARYTCVARNVAGETTREFLLAVHGNVVEQPRAAWALRSVFCRSPGSRDRAFVVAFQPRVGHSGHAQSVGPCAWPHVPLLSPQLAPRLRDVLGTPHGSLSIHLCSREQRLHPAIILTWSQDTSRVNTHVQD